jgi:muramoyltetrapeptide carboxypeptidase
MTQRKFRIAVVAPAVRIEPALAERVKAVAAAAYPAVDLQFHPQCFLSSGHFAGEDAARADALAEMANDTAFDALWIARGGYGSCRIAEGAIARLTAAARKKTYLGYSDAGFLLAGLYRAGFPHLAHGPMCSDIKREGGEAAVKRTLSYLTGRAPESLEPNVSVSAPGAAFNITVLTELLGTPLEPDLAGHVLMLEEVSEAMYRIDRSMFHITSNASIRKVKGIRLGRCSDVTPNDPPFGQSEEQVVRHWCQVSGIPYLGRADIGHDAANKIVPFGRFAPPSS